MTDLRLAHADGALRNYAELSRVRREQCSCEKSWDDVPAKERFVMRDTIFGNVFRWRCEACAAKDYDRMQERRLG